ncbi:MULTISPECIES: DUF4230 domain-containing protein [Micromonospora]|uniref:DUF4230 domain-containing protein n=1 Tax=Micromonospora TaxID=1873 RepID=UPI001EE92FFC|nr:MULTISPECIES: DUF4230 domain-containing protein [Micromonospora]MCG5449215.1 DUF4230 domain-containing protein [Micromonospora hortensis]MCX5119119.1 DUF4230 domain-containing protein [Micromonospora sp. NBC_00362]WTI08760.1 DUF4230 domain-containing protein [Micromonospora sp. NBC_00821]
MARDAGSNEPTREFPGYPTGDDLKARSTATPEWTADAPGGPGEPAGPAGPGGPGGPGGPTSGGDGPVGGGGGGAARGLLLLLGAAALAVVALLGIQATGILPEFRNPFAKEQTDRSQPPLLKSIQDLSRYVAAEGNFQVVVDTQNDRRNVPDFLLNERTLFVGAGSIEAYVDFTKIGEGAVVQSADGKSVEIKLPAPQLGETNLDMEKSYVFAEQRGLLNRLGDLVGNDPNRQQQVYQLAEERITAAARDSGLSARAEENTRKMLEGLLRSLGYQQITVTYIAP